MGHPVYAVFSQIEPKSVETQHERCHFRGTPQQPAICVQLSGLRKNGTYCFLANRAQIRRTSKCPEMAISPGPRGPSRFVAKISGLPRQGRYRLPKNRTRIPRGPKLHRNGHFSGAPKRTAIRKITNGLLLYGTYRLLANPTQIPRRRAQAPSPQEPAICRENRGLR